MDFLTSSCMIEIWKIAVGIIVVAWGSYQYGRNTLDKQQRERKKNMDELYANTREAESSLQRQEVRTQQIMDAAEEASRTRVERYRGLLLTCAKEIQQAYPWTALQVADILELYDLEIAKELKNKAHPALKAAEEVASIAKEKHALQKENKMLQYQITYYESLFPWLDEFKAVPPQRGWIYANETQNSQSEYESMREWLSPEEYQELPTSEKYQLALDRYNSRKKNDWEVGIEFERYIGYVCESMGAKVRYSGARDGLEDMGRDLLVNRGDSVLVIQCKRWAKEKTIHEKHIFQLFGTTTLLRIKDPKTIYTGTFITTAKLSDLARQCAEQLHIEVIENYEMKLYPMIKCHDSPNGKIYHLPMDQQYDRVQIGGKPGSTFAWTVAEAEKMGFRRAYRWNPHKNA